jgi:hypothetical protein
VVLSDLGALVLSYVGTIVVPRAFGSRLTAFADRLVDLPFRGVERLIRDSGRRDDVLAFRAAAGLMMQLAVWLVAYMLGFALLLSI